LLTVQFSRDVTVPDVSKYSNLMTVL
jgi:hypothetical protein